MHYRDAARHVSTTGRHPKCLRRLIAVPLDLAGCWQERQGWERKPTAAAMMLILWHEVYSAARTYSGQTDPTKEGGAQIMIND